MALATAEQEGAADIPRRAAAFGCSGLSRSFGGLKALRSVSFEIAAGEMLGILGPNGAGKSTLINVASGLIPATSGTVHVHGDEVTHLSLPERARRGLLRTFQNTRPSEELTGSEMLRLAALAAARKGARPRHGAAELLGRFGLKPYAGTILSDLPYGVQKMFNLAAVAVCRSRVMLLDEPFQGVAEAEIARLSDLIRHFAAEGVAIGLVEHNVRSLMRLCDRVIVLDSGALIFEGQGSDAVRDPKVREAYLGHRFASQTVG